MCKVGLRREDVNDENWDDGHEVYVGNMVNVAKANIAVVYI